MACIEVFCDLLDPRGGEHACELPADHTGPCVCECEACLTEEYPAPRRSATAAVAV